MKRFHGKFNAEKVTQLWSLSKSLKLFRKEPSKFNFFHEHTGLTYWYT